MSPKRRDAQLDKAIALIASKPEAGGFVTKEQLEVFVSNTLQQFFTDEIVPCMEATFRGMYKTLVDHGALVPEGVERIRIAREMVQAQEKAAEQRVEWTETGVRQDTAIPTEPNLTIQ